MPTLTWRLVERWLSRRVPMRSIDGVLRDLGDDYAARQASTGRLAASVWLWREARSVARAYDEASRATRMTRMATTRTNLPHEIRMAWCGVQARGWRAVTSVALLGVALAVNATVFSAADAFVFHTQPYAESDRLAVIEAVRRGGTSDDYIMPQYVNAWREHPEVLAGLEGHDTGAIAYLTIGDATERVSTAEVTPGLFGLLGVVPEWGRPFVPDDAAAGAPPVVLISRSLARRLFGTPEAAVGRQFSTGRDTPTVVGVMPASFRFPTAAEEIWTPLDLSAWADFRGLRNVARIARDLTMDDAVEAFDRGSAVVRQAVDEPWRRFEMRLRPLVGSRRNAGAVSIFAVLLGAAACLLLIACANVVSLEVAAAARRGRQFAVQSALGASRASLLRVAMLEGLVLLGASAATAVALGTWGGRVLAGQLTADMRESLANPLDLDGRTLLFMVAVAALMWLLTALPVAWRVSRVSIIDGLRDDPRVMPVTRRSTRSRQLLMTGQVALTVLLLVGALLYVQTYAARVGLDKGFDASNIVTVQVLPSPDAPVRGAELESQVLERLRTTPGVLAASRTSSLPPSTQSGGLGAPMIDGVETDERLMIHFVNTDPDYFTTMGIGIVEGSPLVSGGAPGEVVIDERFARKFWPDRSPVGSRFSMGSIRLSGIGEFHIIGVSRQLRTDELVRESGEDVVVAYMALQPDYHPLSFVARLGPDGQLARVSDAVRGVALRSVVRIDTMEARYARLAGDTRLAAAITGGLAGVALLVATSGVYAVMAFLVAGRRREIGIRMALGADRPAVQKMVFSSALRFVTAGTIIGLAAAALASRAIASQLFGVTPTDVTTYLAVAVLVAFTAIAATWWPARRAARLDPAVTLRAE